MQDALVGTTNKLGLCGDERSLSRRFVAAFNRAFHLFDRSPHATEPGAIHLSSPFVATNALFCRFMVRHDDLNFRWF